jgi:hypothetical protein
MQFQLSCSDGHPHPNYWLQSPHAGKSDTVSVSPFTYVDMPAGSYGITVQRPFYSTHFEIAQVFDDVTVTAVLTPITQLDGDADNNGSVSIGDAVYLINYIFGGGPYPPVWASVTSIDGNAAVSIGDAVYLINFIFGGGPPPGES